MFSKKFKSATILSTFAIGVAANGAVSANADIAKPELEIISNKPSDDKDLKSLDAAFENKVTNTNEKSMEKDADEKTENDITKEITENSERKTDELLSTETNSSIGRQKCEKGNIATNSTSFRVAAGTAASGLLVGLANSTASAFIKNSKSSNPVNPPSPTPDPPGPPGPPQPSPSDDPSIKPTNKPSGFVLFCKKYPYIAVPLMIYAACVVAFLVINFKVVIKENRDYGGFNFDGVYFFGNHNFGVPVIDTEFCSHENLPWYHWKVITKTVVSSLVFGVVESY